MMDANQTGITPKNKRTGYGTTTGKTKARMQAIGDGTTTGKKRGNTTHLN